MLVEEIHFQQFRPSLKILRLHKTISILYKSLFERSTRIIQLLKSIRIKLWNELTRIFTTNIKYTCSQPKFVPQFSQKQRSLASRFSSHSIRIVSFSHTSCRKKLQDSCISQFLLVQRRYYLSLTSISKVFMRRDVSTVNCILQVSFN